MKKICLALLLSVLMPAYVLAVPVYFDPDGAGTVYNPTLITELGGTAGVTSIQQFFGSDNKLGNGDISSEDLVIVLDEANDGVSYDGEPTDFSSANVKVTATGLTGTIGDFNNTDTAAPDITDAMDTNSLATALQTVNYSVSFDTPQYLTLTENVNQIGTFELTQGGTTLFDYSTNATTTAIFGAGLRTSALTSKYFYFADFDGVNYTIGQDYSDWLLANDDYFFLALADSSVDLTQYVENLIPPAVYNPYSNDGFYVVNVNDNGTDVTFSAVPEPSTFLLLGSGLMGLGFFARRRKK